MKDKIASIKISPDISIQEALKRMDKGGLGVLFVCDNNDVLIGSLTDGDIRRSILKTGNLQEPISSCFNPAPVFAEQGCHSRDELKTIMLEKPVEVLCMTDNQKKIVDILFWRDLFEKDKVVNKKIDIPVVIVAGGKGRRLGPFTKILPKPLIPIGEKPIIEIIIDKFREYSVQHFYVILNYKGEMIRTYLESIEKDYKIEYIREEKFLGTAGGLSLLPSTMSETFIVSNCDIFINSDYNELLSFHNEQKNILTVVGAIQYHKIPYGIIDFEKGGKIKQIREKPEFTFTVNTGLYVVSKEALAYIPDNKFFDMTELLQVLLTKKESVGVYPISQNSYIDVGQQEQYKKVVEELEAFV